MAVSIRACGMERGAMGVMRAQLRWLLESDEPWTRFHALLELDGRRQDDPDVVAGEWPGYPLLREPLPQDARPPGAADHRLAKRTVEAHVVHHGWTCPGWHRGPHPVRPG